MTNEEAFEGARAGDWIAESFSRAGGVFTVSGKSAGYSSFADCLDDGQSIFYAAFDEDDNREAGLAVWDATAKTLTTVEVHATLIGGAFIKGDPEPLQFTNGGTITGTLNATAFNTIWRHVFEKGNPHETQADEIDQSNPQLGDTVQEALNKIAAYVVQLDPDGDTDIDWGDLDGLKEILDAKAEQSDLDQEILDRIAADKVLQEQINAIDPDGDSDIDWSDIENKPAKFPPESHGHEISDVSGLQDALDAAGGTPAWADVTGKPTEFPPSAHTHEQKDIDGLENRLSSIEGSISNGGGFVDAPDDGKLYGRQSEAWAEVVIPDGGASSWDEIADKPAEFPPVAHNQGWDTITDKPDEYPPESHNHVVADITDFDPADYQPVGDYIGEAPNDGKQYVRESEDWAEVSIPEPDTSIEDGDTEGQITTWDGTKWMPEGAVIVNGGNVGIGTDTPLTKLHISEDTGSAFLQVTTKDDTSSGGVLMGSSSDPAVGQVFYDHSTNSMRLVTNGEERMIIEDNGTVNLAGGRMVIYLGNDDKELAISFKEKDGTEAIRMYSDEAGSLNFWDGENGILRMKMDINGDLFVHGRVFADGVQLGAGGGGGESFWEEESPGVIKYSGTAKANTLIGTG